MGETILVQTPQGISYVSISSNSAPCPHCDKDVDCDKYYKRICNTKKGWLKTKCPHCNEKIGVTSDIRGDAVVFDPKPKGK